MNNDNVNENINKNFDPKSKFIETYMKRLSVVYYDNKLINKYNFNNVNKKNKDDKKN